MAVIMSDIKRLPGVRRIRVHSSHEPLQCRHNAGKWPGGNNRIIAVIFDVQRFAAGLSGYVMDIYY